MKKLLIISLFTASLVATPLFAAEPDDAIKYRKNVMSAVGGHIKSMVAILKGKVEHKDSLKAHADGFAASATAAMTIAAFKQNTAGKGSEKTTSTPKIWENWADFEKALVNMEAASKDIQALAAAGKLTSFDQLKPALKECGYCHRKSGFREKKK